MPSTYLQKLFREENTLCIYKRMNKSKQFFKPIPKLVIQTFFLQNYIETDFSCSVMK